MCHFRSLEMGHCLSKNQELPTCVACFQMADTVLYPCGHFCLCKSCAEIIARLDTEEFRYIQFDYKARQGMRCPMCRKRGLPAIVYQNSELSD